MTTFNFGFGPVPAHRHPNPNGVGMILKLLNFLIWGPAVHVGARYRRISKRQHIENLKAAIRRGDRWLDEMHSNVPPNPPCCASCWLHSCEPGYGWLTEKQRRRREVLQRLERRPTDNQVFELVAQGRMTPEQGAAQIVDHQSTLERILRWIDI